MRGFSLFLGMASYSLSRTLPPCGVCQTARSAAMGPRYSTS